MEDQYDGDGHLQWVKMPRPLLFFLAPEWSRDLSQRTRRRCVMTESKKTERFAASDV
jgi:hypothetical protein